MTNLNEVQNLVFQALINLNEERELEKRIVINSDTCLFGANAELDSLSLVSVIVDVEEAASNKFQYDISLTDDRAMEQEISPYTNVNTLTNYILMLLSEKNNA